MRRWRVVLALSWLLLAGPAWALDLVKIATIPRGYSHFSQAPPVGDADHDGRRELVFEQSQDPFSLNIWEHWGSNSYQPVLIKEGCHPVALDDPDQDGLSDLLCQWGPRAFLLESYTPDTFPSRMVWEEPLGGFPGILGYFVDTDQDGQQEMWIVPSDSVIEVWENQGDNTYVQVDLLTNPQMNPGTLAFGDFDGDGRIEALVGTTEGLLFMWEAIGDDSYALVWVFENLDSTAEIVAAAKDGDGDGKPEFLVGGRTLGFGHGVTIFEATGDNTYAPIWQLRGEGSFSLTNVAVGDVDGDGMEEFAVAIPGAVQIYKAVGDNDFRLIGKVPYPFPPFSDPGAIQLADLNGNGVDELIVLAPDTKHIFIYELADLQPPVLIPAWFPGTYRGLPGLPLPVKLELFNRTAEEQRVDAWVEVYRGSGEDGPQGPLLRQEQIFTQEPLPPQTSLSRWVSLRLPRRPGLYTLQLKVGTFPDQVVDTRWVTFSVGLRPPWDRATGSEGD